MVLYYYGGADFEVPMLLIPKFNLLIIKGINSNFTLINGARTSKRAFMFLHLITVVNRCKIETKKVDFFV